MYGQNFVTASDDALPNNEMIIINSHYALIGNFTTSNPAIENAIIVMSVFLVSQGMYTSSPRCTTWLVSNVSVFKG